MGRAALRVSEPGLPLLQDNVVMTADGCYSLTDVPREVADVEAVMAGEPWPRKKLKV